MASIDITEVRNARYITPRGDIDLDINHPEFGWIEYTIALDDDDMTIDNDQLIALAEALPEGIAAFDQSVWDDRVAQMARGEREWRLSHEVDPIVTNPLRWEELGESKQQEWRDYRTALLNVPQQDGFPNDIDWPTKPE